MEYDGGYIKLYRKSLLSRHASMGAVHIGVWDSILLRTNWKEGYFNGVLLEAGQMAFSQEKFAKELKISRKQLRVVIRNLTEWGMIRANGRANQFTVLTVCNWATYQNSEPAEGQPKGQPRANQGPTEGQPRAMNKEGNKLKKERTTTLAGSDGEASKQKNNAFADWIDANRKAGRQDPIPTGQVLGVCKTIAASIPDHADRARLFDAFLADTDPFLVNSGHPIGLFMSRVEKYRNGPSVPGQPPKAAPAIEEYYACDCGDLPEPRKTCNQPMCSSCKKQRVIITAPGKVAARKIAAEMAAKARKESDDKPF